MVKTKDYVISTTDEQTSYKIPKKKDSIYLKGIKQSDVDITSFKIVGDNLLFTANNKDYTISNYKGIKYIKTNNGNKIELLDIITSNCIDNTNEIKSYNTKKLTVTGTNYNDKIDLSETGYTPKGKTNIKKNKGLTISGGNGSDEITGTDYNDIIKGGNGNDIIEGGVGADTITGGAGITVINYTKGDGNDVINLTKGEELTLNISGVDDITKLKFGYTNKNKDLRIYTDKNSTTEYITIKNFASKNVVGNGKVELTVGDNTYDLRTSQNITNPDEPEDVTLYTTTLGENAKNFTGTWLNDDINASEVKLYKKVKEGKKKVTVEKDFSDTGLTLKGGAGNDTITGTKYSDKIYGNTGNDTINAGTGNNYLYFNKGDGNDIVENGNGIDTLVFAKGTNIKYDYYQSDIILSYNNNDKVTLKDYLSGHSVKYIQIGNIKTEFKPDVPKYNEYTEGDYYVIEGSSSSDYIRGTDNNNKIYGYDGDDIIYCVNGKNKVFGGLGNDILYGGCDDDTYYFEQNFGNDIIYDTQGITHINFMFDNSPILEKQEKNNDLIIYYNNNKENSIRIKDFFSYISKDLLPNYGIGYRYNQSTQKYQSSFIFKSKISVGTNAAESFSMRTIGDGSCQGGYIFAGGGNDIISGEQNNSSRISQYKMIVYADEGDDTIVCGYEHDTIYAGSGNDTITSINPSQHLLYGGDGNDTYYINMVLNGMDNTIYDSSGNDTLIIEGDINNIGELYFNIYKNGGINPNLYIKSTNKLSKIKINEFINESTIEKIVLNNNTKEDTTDDLIIHFNKDIIDNIISDVSIWLSDKPYNSVESVINSNNTEDINYVMQIYNQNWGINQYNNGQ